MYGHKHKAILVTGLLVGIISILFPNAMATGDIDEDLDLGEDVNVDIDNDVRSGDQPVARESLPEHGIPTPVPTPAPTSSDEDFEINQEKVLELNAQCNIPILAVQKSAECNANVEQANCEAMGMRTNEQGQCEDIDIFGSMPILTPLVVEESPVDNKPVDTGEEGDSEENRVGGIDEDRDVDQDVDVDLDNDVTFGDQLVARESEPEHEQSEHNE
jgi:hypothetical protein